MNRLAIDTSSFLTSVALERDDGQIVSIEEASPDSHSVTLAVLVEQLLEKAGGISFADINSLAIGLGPGSFTGLRIGMSYIKGISWAKRIPLSGIPSFLAMANSVQKESGQGPIVVLSDARRSQYFYGVYQFQGTHLKELEPIQILDLEQLNQRLCSLSKIAVPLIIDAGNQILPEFEAKVLKAKLIAEGLLRQSQRAQPWSVEALSAIEPLYVRAVAAMTVEERRNLGNRSK